MLREALEPELRDARTTIERLVQVLGESGYEFRRRPFTPADPQAGHELDAFEAETGRILPLTFRLWLEVVGTVDFVGSHPQWPWPLYNGMRPAGPAISADPLVVEWSTDDGRTTLSDLQSDPDFPRSFRVEFAPDPGHKANYSSSGTYNLPALAGIRSVEGIVRDDDSRDYRATFLEHVRHSLGCFGFPGLFDDACADPETLLPVRSELRRLLGGKGRK